MKPVLLIALTVVLGCHNLTQQMEQKVDGKIEAAKEDMNADVQKAKQDFTARFKLAIGKPLDTSGIRKLQELKFSMGSTDNYLDSLKKEMDKLNENDVRNVGAVKTTFLYNGDGDSIINKVKRTIAVAQNATKSERQKLEIKSASDSLFTELSPDKWKEQMFGLTNPLGASMIIYGLQTELYSIAIKALR